MFYIVSLLYWSDRTMYIAHIRSCDGKIQTVKQHLLETSTLAENIGAKINAGHLAGLAGMLHDMGKYTNAFKEYIMAAVQNPENPPKRGSVDHSSAGGKLLFDLYHINGTTLEKIMAEIVGNAIISHHGYLQDFITPELNSKYLARVKEKSIEGYDEAKANFFSKVMSLDKFQAYVNQALSELKCFIAEIEPSKLESFSMFLTKYIFSALIDADRTNTQQFEEKQQPQEERSHHLFENYYNKLQLKLESFKNNNKKLTPINKLRDVMSLQCEKIAAKPSNIYSLSIPTGGGKTLASLRYALKHATLHNKKRIIYIVPFTTIIEQNAEEVRQILQDDSNILEHHSNVFSDNLSEARSASEDGVINTTQKLLLAKDNWDAPIIFTTMVQFLNVFYSPGTRNIRRLHNLSESVIIFDEVQKVPIKCISLFNHAANFLKNYCQSSLILCTATQPALRDVHHQLELGESAEMIGDIDQVVDKFKRVKIIDNATASAMTTNDLVEFVLEHTNTFNNQLIILNTKSVVKQLYQSLKESIDHESLFHLSTSMCAAHRKDMLKIIRQRLKDEKPVICISTQLIEAGIDVSFESVIRSLSGLDSLAQAAGRCNRHGEFEKGYVYLIDHKEENLKRLPEIKTAKIITYKMLIDMKKNEKNHGGDLLSRQAMTYFFKSYYAEMAYELDYPIKSLDMKMTNLLVTARRDSELLKAYQSKWNQSFPLFSHGSFHTAASHFNVISSQTVSILVPYSEGVEVIADINGNDKIEDWSLLFKRAQQYSVNIFDQEFARLREEGALVEYFDGAIISLNEKFYSNEYGVDLEGDAELHDFIF